jgi:5-(carboxyamino)imidazole ribonucleotide synthase
LDLPLGSVARTAPAVATVNVLGGPAPVGATALHAALGDPGVRLHLYGKTYRPGRKLGHVTVLGDDPLDVGERAWHAARAFGTPRPRQQGDEA